MRAKVIKVGKFPTPFQAGPLDTLTLEHHKNEIDKETGRVLRVIEAKVVHKQGFSKTIMVSCWALIEISGNPGYVVGDDAFYDECMAELNYQEVTEELNLTEHQHGR